MAHIPIGNLAAEGIGVTGDGGVYRWKVIVIQEGIGAVPSWCGRGGALATLVPRMVAKSIAPGYELSHFKTVCVWERWPGFKGLGQWVGDHEVGPFHIFD